MTRFHGGKLPAQPARPQLRLSTVLGSRLTAPPEAVDWQDDRIVWPMYANDLWGCCVFAEIGHAINQLTYYGSGTEIEPSESAILGAYSKVTGFDPSAGPSGGNPTDRGTYVQDALKYWRKTGIAGHKIVAYASLDVGNLDEIRQAIALFGSISIGMNFPDSAMDQFDTGQVWDVVRGAHIEGGHCVLAGAYDSSGVGIVTWGAETKVTWRFFQKYADEAWVCLDKDGLTKAATYFTGAASLYALGQDFAALTGEHNPVPAPPPQPTPAPPSPPAPSPVDPRLARAAALAQELDGLMQALAHDNCLS
ncbi:hypothetical protein [Streptomyces sp. NPDC001492]